MKKLLTTTEGVQIVFDKTVARVSHIALSSVMGVLPQSTMKLIKRYEPTLNEHGLLGFKIQVIKGRGQPEQVAWLNENQCYFILTLSRNTDKVVQAKSNLIKAFSAARELLAQRATQYLPMHHAAHDAISHIAHRAREHGSTTAESVYHMSYEKLINAVFGIEPNSRAQLDVATQCAITAAYTVINTTLKDASAQGLTHQETYLLAKHNVAHMAAMMGTKRLECAA